MSLRSALGTTVDVLVIFCLAVVYVAGLSLKGVYAFVTRSLDAVRPTATRRPAEPTERR